MLRASTAAVRAEMVGGSMSSVVSAGSSFTATSFLTGPSQTHPVGFQQLMSFSLSDSLKRGLSFSSCPVELIDPDDDSLDDLPLSNFKQRSTWMIGGESDSFGGAAYKIVSELSSPLDDDADTEENKYHVAEIENVERRLGGSNKDYGLRCFSQLANDDRVPAGGRSQLLIMIQATSVEKGKERKPDFIGHISAMIVRRYIASRGYTMTEIVGDPVSKVPNINGQGVFESVEQMLKNGNAFPSRGRQRRAHSMGSKIFMLRFDIKSCFSSEFEDDFRQSLDALIDENEPYDANRSGCAQAFVRAALDFNFRKKNISPQLACRDVLNALLIQYDEFGNPTKESLALHKEFFEKVDQSLDVFMSGYERHEQKFGGEQCTIKELDDFDSAVVSEVEEVSAVQQRQRSGPVRSENIANAKLESSSVDSDSLASDEMSDEQSDPRNESGPSNSSP